MFAVSVYRSVETNFLYKMGAFLQNGKMKNCRLTSILPIRGKNTGNTIFLICQLPAPQLYLGHCRKDHLVNPKSITTFLLLNSIRRSRAAQSRSRLLQRTSLSRNIIAFHLLNLTQETCVLISCYLILPDIRSIIRYYLSYYLLQMKSTNRLMMTMKKLGVFLDISKAFDKVYHLGLLYKMKQNSIAGNILTIWTDFSSNRKQSCPEQLVFNMGYCEVWASPRLDTWTLPILIYICDLFDNLSSNPK